VASFKDCNGQEWSVEFAFGHLKPMREKFGLDTKATVAQFSESFGLIIIDPEKQYELLIILCDRQIKERKLDPLAFALLLTSDVLQEMPSILASALASFPPAPIFAGPKTAGQMAGAIRESMGAMDTTVSEKMREQLPSLISKLSAGKSGASVESTHALTLSAN
jgi:hypothetical protein